MARSLFYTTLFFLFVVQSSFAQKFGFDECLRNAPDRITTFCVPNTDENVKLLNDQGVMIKYSISDWLFISTTPEWIDENMKNGKLSDFYFEFAPPALLTDTARAHHYVNEVHSGVGALAPGYTGKDVIVGFVDSGIDFNHPDFIDSNGNIRVIGYWDQTMPDNSSSPQPYGYGYAWNHTQINSGQCTSLDSGAHGTTVAGQAVGNGLANGTNKGIAPEAQIVIIESDFTRPNWTLTVADACDYVFRVADSLGLPAVVNLSLGTYFGSHDGNDPAAEAMEAMLDEKYGRIIVGAAGNAGAKGRHHQQGNPTADTNFVWFVNASWAGSNPVFGLNTIFFDLWSDVSDATWDFAMGANKQGPSWSDRGRTNFHGAMSSIGTTIYDTLWNNGNRLLTIEVSTEIVGSNYHMQFLARIDSTNMRYRFETTGSGKYDLWSGEWLGFNNQYWYGAPLNEFPDSIYYVGPDTLQSIVSSWNCSEKVVSVGNMRNRLGHIDNNGNQYYPVDMTPPGKLSPNSSKGPSRHNVVKPDIVAAGDVSLSAGPISFITNPAFNTTIDSGGYHIRNGGTSMAAPVVSGIAALYLERCPRATYQDFLDDIITTAFPNNYTGVLPNYAYGHGVVHAQNAMLEQTFGTQPSISTNFDSILVSTSSTNGYQWFLDGELIVGAIDQSLTVTPPFGTYEVETYNIDGCPVRSEPFVVTASIKDLESMSLLVYPNPSTNAISIETEQVVSEVIVEDMNGKRIRLNRIFNNTFDTSNIESGTYVLLISVGDLIYSSKIVQM